MKNSARKKALANRRQLSADLRNDYSKIICNKLINDEWYRNANNILCYSSYNSEVDTSVIINDIIKSNKNLYLPRCKVNTHELDVVPVTRLDELKEGAYGIIEPLGRGIDINKIDLVIVPMVAFNKNRMRIGYGAGYYDRLLYGTCVRRIGIAFDVQETTFDDFDSTDVPMDKIITEGVILA